MANEEKSRVQAPHSLVLDERERLTVTGVQEVVEFNEDAVSVKTVKGLLLIRGSGLHVDMLEKQAGQLRISGLVIDLGYEDVRDAAGFFAKLFH